MLYKPIKEKMAKKSIQTQLSADVLLIDHEIDTEEVMRLLQQEDGYATTPRPDLIAIDLSLPTKKGAELLAKIRCNPSLQDIPIVILTASETQSSIFQTYGVLADAYLSKPVETSQFDMVINSLLLYEG